MCSQLQQILRNMKIKKKKNKYEFASLFLILLVGYLTHGFSAGYAKAQEIRQQEHALEEHIRLVESLPIPDLIEYVSKEIGGDTEDLKRLAKCESSFNPQAINYHDGAKNSHSYYLFQFKIPTWNEWEIKYFNEKGEHLNMQSPYDSIKLTQFMLDKDQARQWGCAYKLGMV